MANLLLRYMGQLGPEWSEQRPPWTKPLTVEGLGCLHVGDTLSVGDEHEMLIHHISHIVPTDGRPVDVGFGTEPYIYVVLR